MRIELNEIRGESSTSITLSPGMAWALYTDEGPTGMCGQSMSTTCPWSIFYVFENEEAMRRAAEKKQIGRQGKRARIQHGVIGDWSTGRMFIEQESAQ